MSKKLLAVLVGLGLLAAIFWFWQSGTDPQPAPAGTSTADNQTSESEEPAANSQYTTYSESELTNEYGRHIIFFHAGWCPDCRAFKQNLTKAGAIPGDIQVLEADYDSSTKLKQKYGITIQSTFVEVDSQGNQLAKWVGYYKSQGNSFSDIEAGLSGS